MRWTTLVFSIHDHYAVLALRDINPQAPVHILIIPKVSRSSHGIQQRIQGGLLPRAAQLQYQHNLRQAL